MKQTIKLRKLTETVQIAEGGTDIIFFNKYKDAYCATVFSISQFSNFAGNDKRIGFLYADDLEFIMQDLNDKGE